MAEQDPPNPTPASEPAPAAVGDPAPPAAPIAEPAPAAAAKPAVEPPKPAPSAPDWRDRRLAEQTAKRREAERELDITKQQLAEAKAALEGAGKVPALDQAAIDRAAQEKAGVIAAQQAFTNTCVDLEAAGRAQHADFTERTSQLQRLIDADNPAQAVAYRTLIESAAATGEGHEILYALSGDLNEANRLLSMPPVRMAVEIAKKASGTPTRTAGDISKVPPPIRPVTGAAVTDIDPADPDRSDNLDTARWMEQREKQVRANRLH